MMTKLYVPLDEIERDALERLAVNEIRPMIDQARFIIRAELHKRGLLPEDAATNQPIVKVQS